MSIKARISLPGINAETNTNPNNFSLIADQDNVLIKELLSGDSGSVVDAGSGYNRITIPHNLGYIPLVFPFFQTSAGEDGLWKIVNNSFNSFDAPSVVGAVDTENYYFLYSTGVYTDPNFFYRIFYDDMDTAGTPSLFEDDVVIKFSRPGKSATSVNPNDYIMHSSLNNLKILHQGSKTVSLTGGFGFTTSTTHGADVSSPIQCLVFCKFPDGKTTVLSGVGSSGIGTLSWDESKSVGGFTVDNTSIHFFNPSENFDVQISYYFFGTGQNNTVNNGDVVLAITKDGVDYNSANNPDDFNFHSNYPTLKYFTSGTHNMGNISSTTVHEINHNLGYAPFFSGYVKELVDFVENGSAVYATTPYYLGQSTFFLPNRDVSGNIYVDNNKIYLKGWLDIDATEVEPNYPFEFFYKVFNNNLNI